MTLLIFALALSTGQCGLCHPEERVTFATSIHAAENVGCTDCHGGNAEGVTIETAHDRSYRRGLTRAQVPGLCAECHSDRERMRPYNLSTEQYALYQTSQHGKALARGDSRVAVCTDCHGVHNILGREEPASKVFPRRVPETCGACHGDENLMARYGKDATHYQDYLTSRHAVELIQNGNRNAPTCTNCHGVHGATPPGVGDVDKICGACHSSARHAYLDGAHFESFREAGLPECVSCHGSHTAGTATRGKIGESCVSCHDEASEQAATGKKMDVLIDRASDEVQKAEDMIQRARVVPLYVEDFEARVQQAHTFLLEAEPAVHSVLLSEVARFSDRARALGEEIQSEIQNEFSDLRLRRVGLILFWFYLILTIAIIYRFRQGTLKQ